MISLCNEWINYDNVYRAKFSALTVPELVQAYDNLARLDNDIGYLLGKTFTLMQSLLTTNIQI